jgi:hypothetical protein
LPPVVLRKSLANTVTTNMFTTKLTNRETELSMVKYMFASRTL